MNETDAFLQRDPGRKEDTMTGIDHLRAAKTHVLDALGHLDDLGHQINAADLVTEPHLWITPGRRGGQVCVGGQNIAADIVAERVWAEGDVATAMAEWGLSRDVVLMACWWWALHHPPPKWATKGRRLGEWIDWADAYARDPAAAPDPPGVA